MESGLDNRIACICVRAQAVVQYDSFAPGFCLKEDMFDFLFLSGLYVSDGSTGPKEMQDGTKTKENHMKTEHLRNPSQYFKLIVISVADYIIYKSRKPEVGPYKNIPGLFRSVGTWSPSVGSCSPWVGSLLPLGASWSPSVGSWFPLIGSCSLSVGSCSPLVASWFPSVNS